jgi:hypothetical protein
MENPTATTREDDLERISLQRASLKTRHANALSKLMAERHDLRGVYVLADFVDEGLRWSA